MAIIINQEERIFTLQTENSTYQIKADEYDVLLHTYYGEKTDNSDKSKFIAYADRGFSGNPYEIGKKDRTYSLDVLPQEYSCFGTGDYRITGLKVQNDNGSNAVELRYKGYEYRKGKYAIPGMPAVRADADTAETLVIFLADPYSGIEVELYYGVIEELDIITRAARVKNESAKPIVLQKAASLNLDWQSGEYEWLTLCGRYNMERNLQRTEIHHGIQSIGSVRGASSHHYNPFAVVCEKGTDETRGNCYGILFLYSGEFLIEAEMDQMNQTRLVCGIHPDDFSWKLNTGDDFWTPEAVLNYSREGLGKLSRNSHKLIREHICEKKWNDVRRPVLINNWEATYFDFTGEKLISIAKDASELGIELFVMDDGWFGKRDSDNSGLGDWVPNEGKLQCSLKELGERITAMGMQFGIWFEPEAVSEDSDLYRLHPEWAVEIPGRKPCLSRNELILDISRKDVQEYIIKCMSDILSEVPITYVKWDFNRSICDKFSKILKQECQGEFAHRYVLGLYHVLETLTTRFPDVLFEGCSGGGGRFDAGLLYYSPQIWCSDNTDAIERLSIQYGTSFAYPVSVTGAHVSAVPNHQTGRKTPLYTRGCVAMSGTFGYELDINKLTAEEKAEVTEQIKLYKKHYDLIQAGEYYRLASPANGACTVWEQAAEDGSRALITAVYQHVQANPVPVRVKVRGLKPDVQYHLTLEGTEAERKLPYGFGKDEKITGAALEHCGMLIPEAENDYQAWMIMVEEC